MRVLAISDVYDPRVCEVSASMRALMREVQAKGHSITLIAPAYEETRDDPAEDIVRVSAHAVPFGRASLRLMKPHRVLELSERLRGFHYDLVHIYTPLIAHFAGVALARRLRAPVVETWNTFHEEWLREYLPFVRPSWLRAGARKLSRFQCERVDALIVPSAVMQERLTGYGIERPMTVVPVAVDTQLFQRGDGARFRAWHAVPPERPLLLYYSTLESPAELDFAFTLIQRVRTEAPEALFVVVGNGPAGAYLTEQAVRRDLHRNVIFVGALDRPQGLLDAYRAADCLIVSPNCKRQSVLLVEALAGGLPVVTTADIGRKDVLAGERGILLAQDNVVDFTAQVLSVLRDADLRARLIVEGWQHSQQWSASLAAEQIIDCYYAVTAPPPATARVFAR